MPSVARDRGRCTPTHMYPLAGVSAIISHTKTFGIGNCKEPIRQGGQISHGVLVDMTNASDFYDCQRGVLNKIRALLKRRAFQAGGTLEPWTKAHDQAQERCERPMAESLVHHEVRMKRGVRRADSEHVHALNTIATARCLGDLVGTMSEGKHPGAVQCSALIYRDSYVRGRYPGKLARCGVCNDTNSVYGWMKKACGRR